MMWLAARRWVLSLQVQRWAADVGDSGRKKVSTMDT